MTLQSERSPLEEEADRGRNREMSMGERRGVREGDQKNDKMREMHQTSGNAEGSVRQARVFICAWKCASGGGIRGGSEMDKGGKE